MAKNSVGSPAYPNEYVQKIRSFLKRLSIPYLDICLFADAFTHSSYTNENSHCLYNNQRLEFLGDSVLSLVINEFLYKKYKHFKEGSLTELKSILVSQDILAQVAASIDLGSYIRFSKGERQQKGQNNDSILANTLEAFIAAVYLDQGITEAREFILSVFQDIIYDITHTKLSFNQYRNAKSLLQEKTQKELDVLPIYHDIGSSGPDHNLRYQVKITILDEEIARGQGTSVKKAQQEAARKAYEQLETSDLRQIFSSPKTQ